MIQSTKPLMFLTSFLFVSIFSVAVNVQAQTKSKITLTIDGLKIKMDKFVRVYLRVIKASPAMETMR